MTGDKSLILEAYNQVRLYRKYLRDPNGLWKHIVLGSSSSPSQDFGHWSTGELRLTPIRSSATDLVDKGNAWAAAGMARVLATARGSQFAGELGSQMVDLAGWINEILEAAWSFQQVCATSPVQDAVTGLTLSPETNTTAQYVVAKLHRRRFKLR